MNRAVNRFIQTFAPFIMLAVGVIFLCMTIITFNQKKTYLPTTGVIQSIEIEPGVGEDDADDYTVIVEYTVDGTTYYSDLGEMENGFHEGQQIDILYDPEHLDRITLPSNTGLYIGMGFGAVFLVGGIIALIRRIVTGR